MEFFRFCFPRSEETGYYIIWDFWDNKTLKMNDEEKSHFIDLLTKNSQKLQDEFLPLGIAFSRYLTTSVSKNDIIEKLQNKN